jgi:hypothetical protein
MVSLSAPAADEARVAGAFRRLIDGLERSATPRFVGLAIGLAWAFWFLLANAGYTAFGWICNLDPGAVLRTDEIIAQGQRPGTDFFYYYGPFPLLVSRAFFFVFGRSPLSLLALLAVIGAGFAAGLASIVQFFKPTRLGVLLIAVASVHVITPPMPTHGLEAALLIWAVALRIRGHHALALTLACCGFFAKISMSSVLLAGLVALVVCDAIRARSSRPLASLVVVPVALAALFVGSSLAFGTASVLACLDPRGGANLYKAANLGILREGRNLWHPAGHTLGWYLGGLPGPWLAASVVLLARGSGAAVRFVRGLVSRVARDEQTIQDETCVITAVAHVAFVAFFFGISAWVTYYTWLLVVGLTPALGRARLGSPGGDGTSRYGWLALAAFLLLSTKAAVARFVDVVRSPRTWVADTWMPVEEARELKESLAIAHGTGAGVVTAVAHVANFGMVDPTLRQGRYWMMQPGMRITPSVAELVSLAHSSDTLFVTQSDYAQLLMIPEFSPLFAKNERLYEGKHFIVLRAPDSPPPSQ